MLKAQTKPPEPQCQCEFPVAPLSLGDEYPATPKCLLIYHVGHLCEVAPVVPFQHVDQPLNTSSRHAFLRIRGKTGDFRSARKVWVQTATVFDRRIAQRESAGRGSFSYTSRAAPAIHLSRRALANAASSMTGPREVFTRIGGGFHLPSVAR